MKHKDKHTDALILSSGEGRVYNCGNMTAIFKADENETNEKNSISEWWLEPNANGPGQHQHEDNDEVFIYWKEQPQHSLATNGLTEF
ncbi:hypothetical protein Q4E40_19130 [Pontibacter sp. BT731]|uniref:hypothetical protein n=1 Tax=Pontibacter coccineus TaxID=3063328 RepID=UPI0026E41F46|nr:hypothetical protein [Pontibacter sp. BT731]MDO6392256.1 hypothetical protein [Pontibacter sp. BT731]